MDDRQKAQSRLTELLEGDERAVPYIVGFLTYAMDADSINRVIDSYFEHDEKITAMVAAMRVAREAAENVSNE